MRVHTHTHNFFSPRTVSRWEEDAGGMDNQEVWSGGHRLVVMVLGLCHPLPLMPTPPPQLSTSLCEGGLKCPLFHLRPDPLEAAYLWGS